MAGLRHRSTIARQTAVGLAEPRRSMDLRASPILADFCRAKRVNKTLQSYPSRRNSMTASLR